MQADKEEENCAKWLFIDLFGHSFVWSIGFGIVVILSLIWWKVIH
jgi:hypothetical protein